MVDLGVTFPGLDMPGVDLVLPDIRFVQELGDNLKGIVITHAHEDHYGALLSLWPQLNVPVFCTAFTAGMLEAKSRYENGALFPELTLYEAGEVFQVGPFQIEPIYVTHSIPEPMALAIKSPEGRVIHTGDWKLDPTPALGKNTDAQSFMRVGEEGVLALICDSTNAMRTGVSPSESDVRDSLETLISNSRGRVAITTFSSNVGRLRSIAEAAHRAGRKTMLVGSSIRRVADVASGLGMFGDLPEFVEDEFFNAIPANELVIILTGSQGESRAALAKIARDEHRFISLSAGDLVVFSSRIIPGNEKPVIDVKNQLIEQGIDVLEDGETLVHVSGHPRQHELKQMYEWTKPQVLIPVHGETAHLNAQAKLGAEFGIPQVLPIRNGDMVKLAPGSAEIIDDVPHGRIFKDGFVIGNEDEIGVGERRRLSFSGHIAVSVVLDSHGEMADDLDIAMIGLPRANSSGEEFDDLLYEAANGALRSIPKKRRRDDDTVREAVRSAVRSAARNNWGKKPVTTVFVARV